MSRWRVGVDSGGTFTDVCLFDEASGAIHVWKVASTPDDPSTAIAEGVDEGLRAAGDESAEVGYFGHGTTVATNALIQHRGALTGLVTSDGFRDLLELGRQRRPSLYDLQADKPPLLVPRRRRHEVPERLRHDGRIERPLDEGAVREAAQRLREQGAQAVAVCFLYSYVDAGHERRAAEILAEELPDAFITTSSATAPEFREFERLSTTLVNAYLGPVMSRYLARLRPRLDEIGVRVPGHVTQSNGGTISFEVAEANPVRTVLSGPSTGVVGAVRVAEAAGFADVITFDMGGTSTDVALIQDGRPRLANEMEVHGYPLKTPMLDINTVGAGGGSIAYVDSGGLLKVGPRSAGADPGPVCYGRGNDEPTVTDANVVLQVLGPTHLLGGRMAISQEAAKGAIGRLAERLGLDVMATAQGIISVVTANMARAIRVISVQRGHDPRDYSLVAFGGAGPVHAGRLARELEMPRVLVPTSPGILCAMGLLLTDLRTDYALTRLLPAEPQSLDAIGEVLRQLERRAEEWFAAEGIARDDRRVRGSVDMRYAGQNYELNVELPERRLDAELLGRLRAGFAAAHERMYGYTAPEEPIQAVTFRVEAVGVVPKAELPTFAEATAPVEEAQTGAREVWFPEAGGFARCPVYARERLAPGHRLRGPAVVDQMDSTTLLLPGQRAEIDAYGNIIIEVQPA